MKKNNLLENLIKEDYDNYYSNSGVDLSLLERSFIDDAIDAITGKAKETGKKLIDKGYSKIRSLAPTKKGKRLRISNKYQKEFFKNSKEIEDLSYDLAEIEDNLDDLESNSTESRNVKREIEIKQNRIKDLNKRNAKLSKFILTQPSLFNRPSDSTAIEYKGKNEDSLAKLEKEYIKTTHQYNVALGTYKREDHPSVQNTKKQMEAAQRKLFDLGYPRAESYENNSNSENVLTEGWKEQFMFNAKDYASTLKQSLSKGVTSVDSPEKNKTYDNIFSDLISQKNLILKFNNESLKKIGDFILKNKKDFSKYDVIKKMYNELENIGKNINSQKRVSFDNKKLNPAALYELHYILHLYSKSLILISSLSEENPEILKSVSEYTVALNTDTKSIISKENLIRIVEEINRMYYFLSMQFKKEYSYPDVIKKYDTAIVKLYNYIQETEHENTSDIEQKHIQIKKDESENKDMSTTSKELVPQSKKLEGNNHINTINKKLEKFQSKKQKIIADILTNFVKSLQGSSLSDEEIFKRTNEFFDKNLKNFKVNITDSVVQESFAHVRWRRNPRTGLDKIVMVCKSDEYKKPLNREISVAGKKVKEVMCLPKSTKPAKQKEKDRKSSLKRWRKIKANPGKMRKMFVKRKQTKVRSKTLR